jgi:4-hydroxy-tetrahydrodipicolinate synthase
LATHRIFWKGTLRVEHHELSRRLNTIVGIPVTPFDTRGEVDEEAYVRVVENMSHPNIGVLAPNGNTSEFYALGRDEAATSVELTVEHCGSALVMAGIGLDIESAVSAGRLAEKAGASMVMIHQPPHPYRSPSGWIEYHRLIAERLESLGVVLYIRDAGVSPDMIRRLADAVPNLVGVKYAVPDLGRLGDMVAKTDSHSFTWICGLAETWSPFAWLLGVTAYTSGLVNVAPGATGEMFQRLSAGDYENAMKIWSHLQPFEQIRNGNHGELNVSAVKEALYQLGICDRKVRAPISELTESDQELIGEFLEGLRVGNLLDVT